MASIVPLFNHVRHMPGRTDIRAWNDGRHDEQEAGAIGAFNDYQAERDDTFDAGALTARLAALAKGPGS
jgi:hypothetical protein